MRWEGVLAEVISDQALDQVDLNKWTWTPQEEGMAAVKSWRLHTSCYVRVLVASDQPGPWFPNTWASPHL